MFGRRQRNKEEPDHLTEGFPAESRQAASLRRRVLIMSTHTRPLLLTYSSHTHTLSVLPRIVLQKRVLKCGLEAFTIVTTSAYSEPLFCLSLSQTHTHTRTHPCFTIFMRTFRLLPLTSIHFP
ncbi:hypothetical protein AMECASPLE_009173 [Ameca splendens]|uniref:Uncharacterized protein n=1 Tax=Ameca splendens TaxID=208324 RepID=A0ABV0YM89_9TELE